MGLCFCGNPVPSASVSVPSFFLFLCSHKLPDFEGQAGAQEGLADPWVCPECEPGVVSRDEAGSLALPTFSCLEWEPAEQDNATPRQKARCESLVRP